MQRRPKWAIIAALSIFVVFILVSPLIFAKPFVRIDDEGLKGIQIRAKIMKGNDVITPHGPNCGKVQLVLTEVIEGQYTYRFSIDLRKAEIETEYGIWLWADFDDDIHFTIHGDPVMPSMFAIIEWYAVEEGLDHDHTVNGHIVTSMETLGLMGFHQGDTGLTLTTNAIGEYHEIRTGSMSENELMEFSLDIAWPIFKEYIEGITPLTLGETANYADLGVWGVTIHEGEYAVTGGLRFIGPNGPLGEGNFHTEPVTLNRQWNEFEWWAPGYGP
jgi:hypothetical protein